jgi:hypothetical protein
MADEPIAEPKADPESPAEPSVEPATESASLHVPDDPTPLATDAPASEGAAKPARKKKKKKRKKEPIAEGRNPLGPDGRERPTFVLAFPSDPELDRLVKAFELGNYAHVREHGPALIAKSEDAAVREAARELVRRIEPDPLVKILLAISVSLLLLLALWAYKTHGH